MQSETKWHKISEELPPYCRRVLIVLRDDFVGPGFVTVIGSRYPMISESDVWWQDNSSKSVAPHTIVAWSDLPNYEEKK